MRLALLQKFSSSKATVQVGVGAFSNLRSHHGDTKESTNPIAAIVTLFRVIPVVQSYTLPPVRDTPGSVHLPTTRLRIQVEAATRPTRRFP